MVNTELSLLGARVPSLVQELRSLRAVLWAKRKKKKKIKEITSSLARVVIMGKRKQNKIEMKEGKKRKDGWENGRTLYKLLQKRLRK